MDFRRLSLSFLWPLLAQIGVFLLGAMGWLALTRGLFASAIVCGLGAVTLASMGLSSRAFSLGRDLLKRNQPGAPFTSELSRRRLQVLLDQTPSPLLLQPGDGQLIAVNRAARALFGVAYALPVSARKALFADATDATVARSYGLPALGSQIKWQGQTFAVHLAEMEEDNQVSHLAVLTDISADVRAAEATALRDLLKVLNHELMNALTPVASMSRSALDLLGDDTPDSRAAAVKALERVVARTEGLTDFINAYRALTRLPPPVIRACALVPWLEVLSESFAAQWAEKGVRFELEPAASDLSLMMDEDQMWLGVSNLLNNGAQAALEKADPCVRLRIRSDGDAAVFEVEDSGKGIASENAEQVFMPFYSTKATGTGVGLSLTKQIMAGHGSSLVLVPPQEARDAPLGGACFRFQIRLAA